MSDASLSYFGIRVTDLERSLEFYTALLDLEVVSRGESATSKAVQLRDRNSGQRLELNWYAPGSPFATPYVPGEGLDHIGVRVRNLLEMRERLKRRGIEPATPGALSEPEIWTRGKVRVMFIRDPDGNFLELYDYPEGATKESLTDERGAGATS